MAHQLEPDTRSAAGPSASTRRPAGNGGRRRRGILGRQSLAGWAFVTPTIIVLGVFLFVPIGMALWVSVSDWTGRGSPFSGDVGFVGLDNYARLVTEEGLTRSDFMTSLRNNVYYVLLVVPVQTVLALLLASILNNQLLKAKSFFRTAFYFPSVTSSVAISLVFLFLFTGTGPVNTFLAFFGVDGPTWFSDSRGLLHLLGDRIGLWDAGSPPEALATTQILGLSAWQWLAGPSVAWSVIITLVIWTTTGTFLLIFLAALQDVPLEVEEAALVDGANRWERFRAVTLPHLRPTVLLVLTLGLIGTWQVFDQVYVMTSGGPGKTTLTPAYLSYFYAFESFEWGVAAAMSFVLFAIIFTLASVQRWLFRDKDAIAEKKADKRRRRGARGTGAGETRARGLEHSNTATSQTGGGTA